MDYFFITEEKELAYLPTFKVNTMSTPCTFTTQQITEMKTIGEFLVISENGDVYECKGTNFNLRSGKVPMVEGIVVGIRRPPKETEKEAMEEIRKAQQLKNST